MGGGIGGWNLEGWTWAGSLQLGAGDGLRTSLWQRGRRGAGGRLLRNGTVQHGRLLGQVAARILHERGPDGGRRRQLSHVHVGAGRCAGTVSSAALLGVRGVGYALTVGVNLGAAVLTASRRRRGNVLHPRRRRR